MQRKRWSGKSLFIFLIVLLCVEGSFSRITWASSKMDQPVTSITVNGSIGPNGFYYGNVQVHAFALNKDGTVWAWGYNSNGQLGDGTITNRSIPIKINSLSGINQISGGMYHSVAKSTSSVYSWGSNSNGQLGNGNYTNSNVPVKISSLGSPKYIDAGFNHNVVLSGNNVMTWGLNSTGQLGNGLLNNSSIPVNVTGLSSSKTSAAKRPTK